MSVEAWRPWPRSIRGLYTLILGLAALVVFGAAGVAVDLAVRNTTAHNVYDQALSEARQVSDRVLAGTLENPIKPRVPGIDLVQVVDSRGQVVAASPRATGRPVLSREDPGPREQADRVTACPWKGKRCIMGAALRISMATDSPIIYAARYEPVLLATGWLETVIGATVLLAVAGTGVVTWMMVGRTLRPVRVLRAGLATLTEGELGQRLPVVPGEGEFAELARTANRALERLERSVERQRAFASDASHELRTPIAGMRAQIEAALMFPEDTDMPTTLRAVMTNLDRLERIITDLLFLARLGTEATGEHEDVDLSSLAAEEIEHRTGGRVTFRGSLEPVLVRGSPVQLTRLLTNLLDNAQRHADSAVDVTVRREDDTVILEVLDDGEGIAEADRERVFQRFTRLDAARSRDAGGSGLGLALVRDIAAVHGGTITIEPSARGARFVLRVPAHPTTPHL